jgi:hypothetical protein
MKKRLQNSSISLQENRYTSIEQMPCAVNASWEADIIIVGFVLMIPKSFKIKKMLLQQKPLS